MMTDDLTEAGLSELHAMAEAIGLRRHRFQNRPNMPHYDLTPCCRLLALAMGAVEVSSMELARRCFRGRRKTVQLSTAEGTANQDDVTT